MRIAVRNLGGAAHPGGNPFASEAAQRASWGSLAELNPDVLLVQEAVTFDGSVPAPESYVVTPSHDERWGSLIAVREDVAADLAWRPRTPAFDAFGTYLAFARIDTAAGTLTLVSVHSPPSWRDETWRGCGQLGPIPAGMARPWPSDVLLDELVRIVASDDAVIAGDWNEAPNYPSDDDAGVRAWFERARNAPWTEAIANVFGGPVRTNFTPNAKRSYQNDHVFLAGRVRDALERVSVWNEPRPGTSDHAGVVIDLNL